MDLAQGLERLAERARTFHDMVNGNEDDTKNSSVRPFLRTLR